MSVLKDDADKFESCAKESFFFLESEFGFRYAGLNVVDEDPRDSYVVAKYRKDELRVDVAWNPYAKSLGVLIRLANGDLKRRERYVYLEPFIEFSSNGAIVPVVPQIYPGMGVGKIEEAMERRDAVFSLGVSTSMQIVAERLRVNLASLLDSSSETIRKYHTWYQLRGKLHECSLPRRTTRPTQN